MNPLRITPIDDEKVEMGSWTKYRGVSLRIARANNSKFKSLFMQKMKPYENKLNAKNANGLDEDTMKDIMCECVSKAMLTDWKDFTIGGEEIPYSQENAYSLLYNDEDCRQFVTDFAGELENFLQEEEAELVGKS